MATFKVAIFLYHELQQGNRFSSQWQNATKNVKGM